MQRTANAKFVSSLMNHSEIVSFIWGAADLIRDTFKRGKYQEVILPLTVLRRLRVATGARRQRVLRHT